MGYIYLTGIFPHCSTSGYKYLLVSYKYNYNAILVEPLKKCQEKTIAYGWEKIDQQFVTAGFQPHTYVLYNEVSNTLKKSFEKYTVNYQLLPPHSHRENKSELSIRNFKDHFKAVFDTLDPDFPIANWGIMFTQAVITMKISAHT